MLVLYQVQFNLHNFLMQPHNLFYGLLGTWTGDNIKCSHIGFHPRHHLLNDEVQDSEYWKADFENTLGSQAILSSFGRLLSQALYFGMKIIRKQMIKRKFDYVN